MSILNPLNFIAKDVFIGRNSLIEVPVSIGKLAEIHNNCRINKYAFINNNSVIYSDVKIGRYTSIARNCEIGVVAHPDNFLSTHSFQYSHALMTNHPETSFSRKVKFNFDGETVIGNDVWIGAKSIIKSGITVGDGAIIGAMSFVNQNVPPYAIVVGCPARIIRYRFDDHTISQSQNLKWWEFSPIELKDVQFDNIELAIEQITLLRNSK
ncbi:CatB-related O-acetyltransferase [Actinobacillus arthritidis]|uniref:CatB-related O-acetyltransferase n=1 Tax=Actinobacillus arthritidis TaxID=157339 RepID=UPI002441BE69|nr:CatB-related O-acetyltransferase [Actinobacillus arthritidis]WGE89176.1 CatB-related O-acetyltransferase [Actinobacillus arthritidis]